MDVLADRYSLVRKACSITKTYVEFGTYLAYESPKTQTASSNLKIANRIVIVLPSAKISSLSVQSRGVVARG